MKRKIKKIVSAAKSKMRQKKDKGSKSEAFGGLKKITMGAAPLAGVELSSLKPDTNYLLS